MKINNTKKAAILATVLSGVIFSNGANAANIAAVGATNFNSTDIGVIEGSYVSSMINSVPNNAVLTGYNGDTAIFNLVDGGNNSIWIRQYTYSQTSLVPNVNINAQGDWTNEIKIGTVKSAPNAHGVATKNGFIYIADYDMGTVGVGKVSDGNVIDFSNSHTVNIKDDLIKFAGVTMQHDWAGELYAHGESVLVDGNTLYVLANIDTYDASGGNYADYFEYSNSYLIKYKINADGTLSFDDCTEMGKNTDRPRINKYNDHVFATAIGGFQGYGWPNEETSLNVATIDKTYGWFNGSTAITVPNHVTENIDWGGNYGTEFRNLKILPNGTAYVHCYAIGMDGYSTSPYIYKTTVSNLLSDNPVDWEILSEGQVAGWFNDIDAEYYTKRIWVQEGNFIKVYLDGATEPIIFTTDQFASDSSFAQIQSWTVIKPDTLTGNIAKLRNGTDKVVNDNANWEVATITDKITSDVTVDSDAVVSLDSNYKGDLTNNILAAIYAKDNNATVTVSDSVLNLQVENTVATPVGIYAGNGKTANVTADTINIITKGMKGGNSLNNAIMLDASAYGTQAAINIDGNVNVAMTGGYGGNGVAIQKTDRLTGDYTEVYDSNGGMSYYHNLEASYTAENPAIITIDGDLAIKGADNQTWGIEANKENVFSRFNNAGILTAVEKGKVIVKGNVDMDVYGNGVTTNAKDSSVTIAKGGQITVPQGTSYGYYTLAAYNGTINMNMGEDGKTIGTDDVVLNGDVFALKTGTINLALVTANSQLNGIVDNGGTANVYLQNGATWNNAANNERYSLDYEDAGNGGTSRITNFYGGANIGDEGVIVQTNADNLTIDNYTGNTFIIYGRDTNDYSKLLGGDVTIKSAAENSTVTLRTDNSGIDIEDDVQVNKVLNNMANKLYYTGYINKAQENLYGFVEIAEGLTASSVSQELGFIDFSETTGQGSLSGYNPDDDGSTGDGDTQGGGTTGGDDNTQGGGTTGGDDNTQGGGTTDGDDNTQGGGTTPEDKPTTPDAPTVPEIPEEKPVVEEKFEGDVDSSNLDNLKNDNTFGAVVVPAEPGKLDFAKLDKDEHGKDKPASEHVDIVKVEGGVKHTGTTPFVWDMDDKGLHIGGKTEVTGGTYEIQNAGDVTFKGNTDIKGDDTNKGELKIDNKKNGGVVKFEGAEGNTAPVLNVGENAEVVVSGKVDITNTNGNVAVEVAKGSTVTVGGGVIGDKDGVAIKVNGGQININENGDEKVVVNGKILLGEAPTTFKLFRMARNIVVPTDSSSITLNGKDSSLNDDVQYLGNGSNGFAITIANGATWTGNSVGGVDLDVILADGGAWTGYHEEGANNNTLDMQISNGAIWNNTATFATTVATMSGEGGFVKMSEDTNAGLTVEDYRGETTFIYCHDADNNIQGGNVTINKAVDGSIVNVRTNSIGTSDKEEVTKVLQALAAKMIAKDASGNVLSNVDKISGEAQIAEGVVTSASALKVGNINFSNGTGELDVNSITVRYPDSDYIYGDSETAMMKGAKSAMASTVMMWRSESNDILQRMGDLRLATEDSGVWAKYYGGKYEMDAQNTKFTTNYKAYQVGYDKAVGNGWNVGVAVSHNEGDSRYDLGGEGEMTVTSLSVYGNKDYGDGRYLGLVLKGSQLKNEYEVFNNDHYKLEGDFKTWGTSISAEYGKRIEKGNGFYFDPSVELTIGHVQGKDYTATSDMLKAYNKTATMDVEQDSFNSIVGRVGFGIGQKMDKASYYAKLALAHEFGGDFETSYTAEETKGTSIDFGDTWYEMQLGGTAKLSDNSLLYATYERSFGGDVTEKWRLDAGLRLTF